MYTTFAYIYMYHTSIHERSCIVYKLKKIKKKEKETEICIEEDANDRTDRSGERQEDGMGANVYIAWHGFKRESTTNRPIFIGRKKHVNARKTAQRNANAH